MKGSVNNGHSFSVLELCFLGLVRFSVHDVTTCIVVVADFGIVVVLVFIGMAENISVVFSLLKLTGFHAYSNNLGILFNELKFL